MTARREGLLQNFSLLVLSSLLTLATIEVGFRAARFDFDFQLENFHRTPIFYQDPTVPVGEAFFRRPGPAVWKGRVLSTYLQQSRGLEDTYGDEDEVTITYDRDGFRNPEDLKEWRLVFAGDSFTELGYLRYEDLFTTQVGEMLHVGVKNLGVGYTGTLTQTCYLKLFGKSPDTTDAFLVFYEGNDLEDLLREESYLLDLRMHLKLHISPLERIETQSSALKAAYRSLTSAWKRHRYQNAYFIARDGRIPVTVNEPPPGRAEMPEGLRAMLESSLSGWGSAARELGLRPWVVFMPCKRRVLDGHLEFDDNADSRVKDWHPNDLPDVVKEMSERNGMRFIDLTAGLAEETRQGELTYNTIYDSHLNREGSLCVARTLMGSIAHAPS